MDKAFDVPERAAFKFGQNFGNAPNTSSVGVSLQSKIDGDSDGQEEGRKQNAVDSSVLLSFFLLLNQQIWRRVLFVLEGQSFRQDTGVVSSHC